MDDISFAINKLQDIASKYGIEDVLQDNNARLVQILAITGLKVLPGRTGNDAVDKAGREYEIKTTCGIAFSTNHHVNLDIINKYRKAIWLFGVFDGVNLKELYQLPPECLEFYFARWEKKCKDGVTINNPKISLSVVVRFGDLIYRKKNG